MCERVFLLYAYADERKPRDKRDLIGVFTQNACVRAIKDCREEVGLRTLPPKELEKSPTAYNACMDLGLVEDYALNEVYI